MLTEHLDRSRTDIRTKIIISAAVAALASVVFSGTEAHAQVHAQVRCISLESRSAPGQFVRHSNFRGRVDKIVAGGGISQDTAEHDATFVMVTGLASGATTAVSFEATNFPGQYLRHSSFAIFLNKNDGTQLFKNDATFMIRAGLADPRQFSFESKNYPGHFLRMRASKELGIDQRGASDTSFNNDATFNITAPRSTSACGHTEPGGSPATAPGCTVSNTDIHRSLVVTDPEILARFSFERVMERLRRSANVDSTTTNKGIFQTWMKTFGKTPTDVDCDDLGPNNYGLKCPRTPELRLSNIDPFDPNSKVKFKAVGLFNRLDLMAQEPTTCGEYRIVFAMDPPDSTFGRGFIIFEAVLPNPTRAKAACLPVAKFWQGLTADNDVTSRAAKLDEFYFSGISGSLPVVYAQNYGLAVNAASPTAGQVRTNFFVNPQDPKSFPEWNLREFKLRKMCSAATSPATCKLRFDHVPAKANPADELFRGTDPKSANFRNAFLDEVESLSANDISNIGMSTDDQFNEFESISQATPPSAAAVNYAPVANDAIKIAIQGKLNALDSSLKPADILARATTQTCAGCHQVSNGAALGGGMTWPNKDLPFVQIDEHSKLSSLLLDHFLPVRKTVLERFINDSCRPDAATVAKVQYSAPLPPARDEKAKPTTLGGSVVGAPN